MSAYPSLLSPLMDATGLIATAALNTVAQTALASGVSANEKVDILQVTALQEDAGTYTGLASTNMVIDGSIECTTLKYTSLDPPIAPGSVPTIEQVLTAGNDCNLKSITNATTIQCNQGFFTNVGTNSASVNILNEGHVAYHNIVANASGLDLNTKWTSDGLILHKVSTGSDITIQNDATNLITLGTATGFADLQVGTLKYTALDPAIPPSSWVGTATSDLNMSDYGITNVPSIGFLNGTGEGVITMPLDESKLDFDGLSIISIGAIGCNNITTGDIVSTTSVETTMLNIVVDSVQVASLSDSGLGVAGGVTSDAGVTGLTLNSSLTTGGGAIANYDNSFSVHSNGDITCPLINAVAPQFKPTYDYYVSKGGNDTTGLGSVLSPFLTVQKAITVCETAYDGTPRVIHLASGTYTQDITFTKSRISIIGEGTSMNPDVGSCIAGVVSIALTVGNSDMNNNNIYFSGLLINGFVGDTTLSIVHRVFFTNCYLYASTYCLTMTVACDYRLIINNCTISNGSTAGTYTMVTIQGSGMISITNTKITCLGLRQRVLSLSNSVRVDTFANNIITSDSSSTLAHPIVELDTSSTISMGNCAFIYSNPAVKSNTLYNSSGINMTSSGDLYILQCFFSLQGLYAPNHCIVNNGSGKVYFGNNIAPSTLLACTIQGTLNTNKFAMVGIN